MERIVNECVGCKSMGIPCMGDTCPKKHVRRFYCDECESEETLYEYEGQQLCADCLLGKIKKVKGSEV